VLLPTLAASSPAQAITNGSDDAADPGVVAIVRGDTLVCTATLVAPRVLVTAAHCVPDGPPPDAIFGSAIASGTRATIVATERYSTFDDKTLTDDIAVALLADPAPSGAAPWPVATTPLDGTTGMPLRLVGFGRISESDATPAQKRVGSAAVGSIAAHEFTLTASPSHTCEGDSGGPAFATIGGVEMLVGITSSGDVQCQGNARDMRADAYAAFIAAYVRTTADGSAGPGDRCLYPAHCAPGAGECAESLDDATLSYCAPPCAPDGSCPAGLSCLAASDGRKLCRHAPPSPGAFGASCNDSSECFGGRTCEAPASGGGSVCTTTCFPDIPGFCPSGSSCTSVADNSASACFAPAPSHDDHHGCAIGGGDVSGALLIVLAISAARRARAV
jgi:hypothetical protein